MRPRDSIATRWNENQVILDEQYKQHESRNVMILIDHLKRVTLPVILDVAKARKHSRHCTWGGHTTEVERERENKETTGEEKQEINLPAKFKDTTTHTALSYLDRTDRWRTQLTNKSQRMMMTMMMKRTLRGSHTRNQPPGRFPSNSL
mgnify:CR=1 FL=1